MIECPKSAVNKSDNWLYVGSSPGVEKQLERPLWEGLTRITCNAGATLRGKFDHYVLNDPSRCKKYAGDAYLARRLNDTNLITRARPLEVLTKMAVHRFDEFIEPVAYPYFPYSEAGTFCIEYAIANGARTVHIIGCDGFQKGNDYFYKTDRMRDELPEDTLIRQAKTVKRYGEIARCNPEHTFIQYGTPHFSVAATNWRVKP